MLYQTYQAWDDSMLPFRIAARAALALRDSLNLEEHWPGSKGGFAVLDMATELTITHHRPAFDIGTVLVGNREVPVREEVAMGLPFGTLLHFAKDDIDTPQPKMLVVAPLSGHFATLLRGTIRTLLRDHDVYVTDWVNARDVPLEDGPFGFDDYVDYLIAFLEHLGPEANILAVCQPCVQTLAAVAVMAEDRNPAQPRTMTLMGGPVDTRVSPTKVNQLATSKPMSWFEDKLIAEVPWRYPGGGRKVYPGFLQLTAFMSMNLKRHADQYRSLYNLLVDGRASDASAISDFYKEYYAVLDMTAEFYLETIDRVFQKALLARGELEYRGRKITPSAITRTALLTVEGERDDICSVGQTAAAHDLCAHLRPHLKRHHYQPGVGHYGIFSGRKWENQVYPQVKSLVLAMA
jgi:poly(3-hydroxybutyrate) depolymerase